MNLKLIGIVKREFKVRSFIDSRVKVIRFVAEYLGDDKEIYRKAFETKLPRPNIPHYGTHEELNALKKQW